MLRGLINIFSLGMDTMGQDLRDRDVFVEVHSGPTWRRVAKNITADREQGAKTGPLVISGHSWGADDAVRLARRLGKNGVPVDGLVLVDPTTPPKIPANVRLCVNFYRSRPSTDWMPWLRGVAVEAESPSTEIINHDLRGSETHPDLAGEVNHFTIEANPEVQEMVVAEILRILEQGNDEAEQVLTSPHISPHRVARPARCREMGCFRPEGRGDVLDGTSSSPTGANAADCGISRAEVAKR
jgi:pimeloyl-ACP methyl ester carboxylesterase